MVDVTQIKNFLGGADNVALIEILNGERIIAEIDITDENDNAINLTNATITAEVEFHRASLSTSQNGTTINQNTLTREVDSGNNPVANKTLTFSATSEQRTEGKGTITIPEDLAGSLALAPAGSNTNVLIGIIYVSFNLGANQNINKNRIIVVIRHAI